MELFFPELCKSDLEISKHFRESIGIRYNESRLYMYCLAY